MFGTKRSTDETMEKEQNQLQYVPDSELEDWARRNGGPAPKQQSGYDYAKYRADLEVFAARR